MKTAKELAMEIADRDGVAYDSAGLITKECPLKGFPVEALYFAQSEQQEKAERVLPRMTAFNLDVPVDGPNGEKFITYIIYVVPGQGIKHEYSTLTFEELSKLDDEEKAKRDAEFEAQRLAHEAERNAAAIAEQNN